MTSEDLVKEWLAERGWFEVYRAEVAERLYSHLESASIVSTHKVLYLWSGQLRDELGAYLCVYYGESGSEMILSMLVDSSILRPRIHDFLWVPGYYISLANPKALKQLEFLISGKSFEKWLDEAIEDWHEELRIRGN